MDKLDIMDEKIDRNRTDINSLNVLVVEIATMMKNSEKRRDEDMNVMKRALVGIEKLEEKVGKALMVEKDIESLKDVFHELKTDVRVNKHDIINLQQGQIGVVAVKSIVDASSLKIESVERLCNNILTMKSVNENSLSTIDELSKKLAGKVEELEVFKNRFAGGALILDKGGRVIWASCGAIACGIILVIKFLISGH